MGNTNGAQTHGNDPHASLRISSTGAPLREATGAVLLLHGRGRTAESILALSKRLECPGMAYLAPQAGGRTWYPDSFLAPLEDNEPGLSSALRALDHLFEDLDEVGIPPERTVIVGFSQGACLAAEFVGRRPRRYGGVAALIGGFFGPEGTALDYEGSLAGTPVVLCTSDPDPYVPPARVAATAAIMEGMGARVDLHIQPDRGHLITDEGVSGALELIRALAGVRDHEPPFAASGIAATAPGRPRSRVADRPERTRPTVS